MPTSGHVNAFTMHAVIVIASELFKIGGNPTWISRSNSRSKTNVWRSVRNCVTVPGFCCCMPLLYNHLIDSCKYVRKNTLLAAKEGCICSSLTPLKSTTGLIPRHQIYCIPPTAFSKNRVWTCSPAKLGHNYTSISTCCRTNQIAQGKSSQIASLKIFGANTNTISSW